MFQGVAISLFAVLDGGSRDAFRTSVDFAIDYIPAGNFTFSNDSLPSGPGFFYNQSIFTSEILDNGSHVLVATISGQAQSDTCPEPFDAFILFDYAVYTCVYSRRHVCTV